MSHGESIGWPEKTRTFEMPIKNIGKKSNYYISLFKKQTKIDIFWILHPANGILLNEYII